MLLLFVIFNFIYCFNQQMLLWLILLVVDGNPLLFIMCYFILTTDVIVALYTDVMVTILQS